MAYEPDNVLEYMRLGSPLSAQLWSLCATEIVRCLAGKCAQQATVNERGSIELIVLHVIVQCTCQLHFIQPSQSIHVASECCIEQLQRFQSKLDLGRAN
jgi:hypothetical protein